MFDDFIARKHDPSGQALVDDMTRYRIGTYRDVLRSTGFVNVAY